MRENETHFVGSNGGPGPREFFQVQTTCGGRPGFGRFQLTFRNPLRGEDHLVPYAMNDASQRGLPSSFMRNKRNNFMPFLQCLLTHGQPC